MRRGAIAAALRIKFIFQTWTRLANLSYIGVQTAKTRMCRLGLST